MDDLPDTQTQKDVDVIEATQEIPVRAPWGRLNSCISSILSIDLIDCNYTFGRAPTCNIFIEKSQFSQILNISKEHFSISRDEELIYVTDLSKNGTFINETKIGRHNKHIIFNGDAISVGHPLSKIYTFAVFDNEHYDYPPQMQNKYFISKRLGRGAFGEVRLAYNKKTSEKYAIKKICKSRSTSSLRQGNPQKIKTEIEILTTFSHPFIISMIEVFESEKEIYLVLEFMQGGELTSRILSSVQFPEKEIKFIFYQILLALRFLHSNGVTHRDLKPENILLVADTHYPMIKVADFGLSKILEDVSLMDTTCGTIHYVAPEILKSSESYNKKVDIWSFGVILFYMLSKTQPFGGDTREEIAGKILTGKISWHSKLWRSVSNAAKDLTKKMLNVNPLTRLSVTEVFKQEWIANDVVTKYNVEQLTLKTFEDDSSEEIIPPIPKRPRLTVTM